MPDEKPVPQEVLAQATPPVEVAPAENKSPIQTLFEDPTLHDRQAENFFAQAVQENGLLGADLLEAAPQPSAEALAITEALLAEHRTTPESRTREEQDFYERILTQAENPIVRRRQFDTMLTELRIVRGLSAELKNVLPPEDFKKFRTSANVAFSQMFSPALLEASSVDKPSTLLEDPATFGTGREAAHKKYDNRVQREGFMLALDSQLEQQGIHFGSFITEVSEEDSPIEFTDLIAFADNYAALGHAVSEAALTAATSARTSLKGSALESRLDVLKKVYAKGRSLTIRGNAVLDQALETHDTRREASRAVSAETEISTVEKIEHAQAVETYNLAVTFSEVLHRPAVKDALRDALKQEDVTPEQGMLDSARTVALGSIRELVYRQLQTEAQTHGRPIEDITDQELNDRIARYTNPDAIGNLDAHATGIVALNAALKSQPDLSPTMVDKVTGMMLAAQYMSRLPEVIKPAGEAFADVHAARKANALGDKYNLKMSERSDFEAASWDKAFDRLGTAVTHIIAELPEIPADAPDDVKLKLKQSTRPGNNLVSPQYNPAVVAF